MVPFSGLIGVSLSLRKTPTNGFAGQNNETALPKESESSAKPIEKSHSGVRLTSGAGMATGSPFFSVVDAWGTGHGQGAPASPFPHQLVVGGGDGLDF
jgi:hypothetical protein